MKKLTKLDRYEKCTIKVVIGLIITIITVVISPSIAAIAYAIGTAIIDQGIWDFLVESAKVVGIILGCIIGILFFAFLYCNFRVAKNIILSILAFGGTYLVALVAMEILDCILFH